MNSEKSDSSSTYQLIPLIVIIIIVLIMLYVICMIPDREFDYNNKSRYFAFLVVLVIGILLFITTCIMLWWSYSIGAWFLLILPITIIITILCANLLDNVDGNK